MNGTKISPASPQNKFCPSKNFGAYVPSCAGNNWSRPPSLQMDFLAVVSAAMVGHETSRRHHVPAMADCALSWKLFSRVVSQKFSHVPARSALEIMWLGVDPENAHIPKCNSTGKGIGMPFSKGQSGNASGGSAEIEMRRAARSESENCIAALASVRDDKNARPDLRLEASTRILALGWPKFGAALESHAQRDLT